MTKQIIGAVLIALALGTSILSAAAPGTAPHSGELRDYMEKTIIPELQQWKKEVDAIFTKEELAKLNELRAKSTELRKKMRALAAENFAIADDVDLGDRAARRRYRQEIRKNMRGTAESMRAEMKQLAAELRPLAEAHAPELKAFFESKKPQSDIWRAEMRDKIAQRWEQEGSDAKKKAHRKYRHRHSPKDNPIFFDGRHDKRKAAMFLLWDGQSSLLDEQAPPHSSERQFRKQAPSRKLNASIFPNPAKDEATLKFTLPESGKVEVTLFDSGGYTALTAFNGTLSAGEQTLNIPLGKLTSGAYMYRIVTAAGTANGKISVTK